MSKLKGHEELKRILECLLFVASEPLGEKRLAEIAEAEPQQVRQILGELSREYAQRGFFLQQLAGGWQFATQADCAAYVEKLYRPKVQLLSRAAMETLAIIAYKQPITRAEIAAIRQVDVDGIVGNLLEKRLIKEVGRCLTPGRALLYGTTDEFLAFFGLNSLEDLPAPTESQLTITEQENTLFAMNANTESIPVLEVLKPNQ